MTESVVADAGQTTNANQTVDVQDDVMVADGRPGPRLYRLGGVGDHIKFYSHPKAFTQIHLQNLGPDDQAVVNLTWVDAQDKPQHIVTTFGYRLETEWIMRAFAGADIVVTNHSANATISVRCIRG